ncbi:MAG: cobalamin-dependent protein [Syntrophaceae bacterium]|nr:cobalamin-dependent protein [Syntrophaceae bacterium]
MNVILVRPPSFKMPIIIPNLGLGYLASILRNNNHSVNIIDCAKGKMNHQKYLDFIAKEKPDIVGIQMYTCDYSSSKRCADIAKELNGNIITIVGGPHPSGDPEGTMENLKNVDFAFSGEAEIGLPKLLDWIELKKSYKIESVEGLIYRQKGQTRKNKRGDIQNLDDIPFPSWDLINPKTYPIAPHGSFSKSLPIAPIITSRGCPFQCTYCGVMVNTGRTYRTRSINNVIEEIKYLQKLFGIKEFHIEDDNFTLIKSRVMEFCKKLLKKNISIDWACTNGIRLDTLDKELLLNMERSGCYSFSAGIESGSSRIIADMKRSDTLETIVEKTNLVYSTTKIRMTGFFMMGYPTETREDIEKTINLALKLPLQRAQFSNFLPLPGTEIYDRLIKCKEFSPDSTIWNFYQNNVIVYSPEGISKKEMRCLMKKAFARFYFRLPIILGLLKEIHSLRQLQTIIRRFFDIFR